MPQLIVNGIAVHYRETGLGAPVVLTHGGGSSGAQWRRVCELLGGRFRLVTVDHYGHGGTDPWPGPPEARTHDADAALVRAVIERVGGPAHLVGHSYGGGVALRLAVTDPGPLRSLTLIEPIAISVLDHAGEKALAQSYRDIAQAFIRDARAGDREGAWQRYIDGNGEPGAWGRMSGDARAKLISMTDAAFGVWYANFNHGTAPDDCRALRLPTLLLYGERTRPDFRRITELIAGLISAAQLHVLPAAAHMSPLSHPESIAEALGPFLAAN